MKTLIATACLAVIMVCAVYFIDRMADPPADLVRFNLAELDKAAHGQRSLEQMNAINAGTVERRYRRLSECQAMDAQLTKAYSSVGWACRPAPWYALFLHQ